MKQNAERAEETVQNVALLKGMMEPIVKDLKEFVLSTVRGSENVLKAEIKGVKDDLKGVKEELAGVKITVNGHSNAIMEIVRELKETRAHLSDKIDKVDKKLDSHSHTGKNHLKLV